jgi:hypothetical protein
MTLWQFASISTATQMDKAIPLLLAVKENTDIIPEIRDDLKPNLPKSSGAQV